MEIKVATVGKGQVLGFNDVIGNRNFSTSLKCVSCIASVFEIKVDEFKFRMQRETMSWNYLLKNAKEIDEEIKIQVKNASNNIGVFFRNKPDKKAKQVNKSQKNLD